MSDEKSQKTSNSNVKKPHERVEKAVEHIQENIRQTGQKNVKSAMEKSGYSPSYAQKSKVDKTKTFMEKFNEIMPEETILGWHNNLGNAKKTMQLQVDLGVEDEYIEEWVQSINCVLYKIIEGKLYKTVLYWARDNKAMKDAIDMAYKLRGDYAPDKVEDVSKNPFMKMTDGELAQALAEAEAFLTKKSPNVPKTADTTEPLKDKVDQEELQNNQGKQNEK
jgi:hypothetical protein